METVDNARLEAEDKMKAGMTKGRAQAQVTDEAHFQNGMKGGRIMPLSIRS